MTLRAMLFPLLVLFLVPLRVPAPSVYVVNDLGAAGDSLRFTVTWANPIDSATVGKADSTLYTLRTSKPAVWVGGKAIAANTDTPRRLVGAVTSDTLKMAMPPIGDSASVEVKNFRQCRKNDCSIAGGAGDRFKRTFAPPPNAPTILHSIF